MMTREDMRSLIISVVTVLSFCAIMFAQKKGIVSKDIAERVYNRGCGFLEGDNKNVDSALYYLNKAAFEMEYFKAPRALARVYYNNDYGLEDKDKSFQYLEWAADLGDRKANLEVGGIYLTGQTKWYADTTIYRGYTEKLSNGTERKVRSKSMGIRPSGLVIRYPDVPIDSVKGYYYYERGMSVNYTIYEDEYLLTVDDFIRAYMDGTYAEQDFDKAWMYLSPYVEGLEKSEISTLNKESGETCWRIQMSYRFGLGTRTNMEKADFFLKKAAALGYPAAMEALE